MSSIKRSLGPRPVAVASTPTPELPQATNFEMAAATLPQLKLMLWKVYKADGDYISNEALHSYGIQHSDLSLSTGTCPDGSHVFISPLPQETLAPLLHQMQPWQFKSLPRFDSQYKQSHDNMEMARTLSRLFHVYLHKNVDEDNLGLMYETGWRNRGLVHRLEKVLYSCTGGEHWEAGPILEQDDPRQSPHIACFLIDNAPMDPNRYSRPELTSVMSLMIDRIRLLSAQFSVFPVTVFSMSGGNFRVIHSYYSQRTQRLVVERSRILNFDNPDLPLMMAALSWILASPRFPGLTQPQTKAKSKQQDPINLPIHGGVKKKKSSWFH